MIPDHGERDRRAPGTRCRRHRRNGAAKARSRAQLRRPRRVRRAHPDARPGAALGDAVALRRHDHRGRRRRSGASRLRCAPRRSTGPAALVPGSWTHQHPLMGADDTSGRPRRPRTVDEARCAGAEQRALPGSGCGPFARVRDLRRRRAGRLARRGRRRRRAGAAHVLRFPRRSPRPPRSPPPASTARAARGAPEIVCRRPPRACCSSRARRPRRARHAAADGRSSGGAAPRCCGELAESGLTAVHAMDGSLATHDELREFEARGELCLRIVAPLHVEPDAPWDELERWTRLRDEHGDRWRGGVAKFFIDGVVEPGTAWLEEPDSEGRGCSRVPDPTVRAGGEAVRAGGFPVRDACHRRSGRPLRTGRLPRCRAPRRASATGSSTSRPSGRAARPLRRRGRRGVVPGDPPAVDARRQLGSVVAGTRLRARRQGLALRRSRRERRAGRAGLRTGRSRTSIRAGMAWARLPSAGKSSTRSAPTRSSPVGRAGAGRLHERGLARSRRGGHAGASPPACAPT